MNNDPAILIPISDLQEFTTVLGLVIDDLHTAIGTIPTPCRDADEAEELLALQAQVAGFTALAEKYDFLK
jgi:hypothetical protein